MGYFGGPNRALENMDLKTNLVSNWREPVESKRRREEEEEEEKKRRRGDQAKQAQGMELLGLLML